jgi:signal transduction histidine kinase
LLGCRLIPISLVAGRFAVAAACLLLHPAPSPNSLFPALWRDVFILAWPVMTLAASFAWPRQSRGAYFATLAVDTLFALCVLMHGSPTIAAMLPIMHGVVWRALGKRMAISPTLPAFLIGWAIFWYEKPDQARWWLGKQPAYPALLHVLPVAAILAAMTYLSGKRNKAITDLGNAKWTDAILRTDQPLACDFSTWAKQVAALYRHDNGNCLVVVRSRTGALQIFDSASVEREPAGLSHAVRRARQALPATMTLLVDRGAPSLDRSEEIAQIAPVLLHVKKLAIFGRRITIGSQHGLVIIALDAPIDAILLQEIALIDGALDGILERANRNVEMRRTFLADAREVARRDVHDGVLQTLAAIRMRLMLILNANKEADERYTRDIRTTVDIIALEQARLRALLDRSAEDDQAVNLVENLKVCAAMLASQWEVDIDFTSDEVAIPMHTESATNVEYLLREIVANATRHSKAKRISCTLAIRDFDLVISLIDTSDTMSEAGLPLELRDPLESQSLQQRLALVNGRAYFEGLKKGTLLAIAIPLSYEEAD